MASPLSRFTCSHYAPPKPDSGSRVRRSNHGRPAMTEQRCLNFFEKIQRRLVLLAICIASMARHRGSFILAKLVLLIYAVDRGSHYYR